MMNAMFIQTAESIQEVYESTEDEENSGAENDAQKTPAN